MGCYVGAKKREETQGVKAEWVISERLGKVNKMEHHPRVNTPPALAGGVFTPVKQRFGII